MVGTLEPVCRRGGLVDVGDRQAPVLAGPDLLALHGEHVAGQDLVHALEIAHAPDRLTEGQVAGDAVEAGHPPEVGMCEDRFHLRAEDELQADFRPVQRLDPEPVTGKGQRAGARVVDREGEHAHQFVHDSFAPLQIALQDGLGVARRAEPAAEPLESGPQFAIVVHLAVEDQRDTGLLVHHRLVAVRDVDDAQPLEAESDRPCDMQPVLIRSAMHEAVGHRLEQSGLLEGPTVGLENSRYATHRSTPSYAGLVLRADGPPPWITAAAQRAASPGGSRPRRRSRPTDRLAHPRTRPREPCSDLRSPR